MVTTDLRDKVIPWYKFIFVAYFVTCGGAFGYEEAIGSAGPALTLLFTLVVPIIYSLPMALAVTELATALPSDEGLYAWIRLGIHESVGFACACVYYFNYVIDSCLYPILFQAYFQQIWPNVFSSEMSFWLVIVGMVLIVAVLCVLGIEVVGSLSTLIGLACFAPFVVCLVWSGVLGRIQPSRDWLAPPPGPFGNSTWADAWTREGLSNINDGFNVAIWSNSGYDGLGSIVTLLRDPSKTFGRSAVGAVLLTVTTYLTALVSLLGAPDIANNSTLPNYSLWEPGYFAVAAGTLSPVLVYVMVVAGMLAAFATYLATLPLVSEALVELSAPAYLDIKFLRWTCKRFDTPVVSIVVNATITIALSRLPFGTLVDFNNVTDSITMILFFSSFVALRYRSVGRLMNRPYAAVPERHSWMAFLLIFFPVTICLWLIVGVIWLRSWIAAPVAAGTYGIGFLLFFLCRCRRRSHAPTVPVDEEETKLLKVNETDSEG
jgi:polyamine:H+ symporter